jgi:hypothetical protein
MWILSMLLIVLRAQSISDRLANSDVGISSLHPHVGPSVPPVDLLAKDDHVSDLTPEEYVEKRLMKQLRLYHAKTYYRERTFKLLMWTVYVIGGVGTLLAAFEFDIWIAVTTALIQLLQSHMDYTQSESLVVSYTQAAISLDGIRAWWESLSLTKKSMPEQFAKLVEDTEGTIDAERARYLSKLSRAIDRTREDLADGSSGDDSDSDQDGADADAASTLNPPFTFSSSGHPTLASAAPFSGGGGGFSGTASQRLSIRGPRAPPRSRATSTSAAVPSAASVDSARPSNGPIAEFPWEEMVRDGFDRSPRLAPTSPEKPLPAAQPPANARDSVAPSEVVASTGPRETVSRIADQTNVVSQ